MMDKAEKGITLIELLVAIAIVGILAVLVAPELGRFRSNYNARSCATDLIQYMRVARAMAIKENREYLIVIDTTANSQRYLIGFDGDGDNNLITADSDTFGICNDADGDRLPEGDALVNGVPSCVRVVNLNDCGNDIIFGYTAGTTPPNGPNASVIPVSGIVLLNGTTVIDFNPDGSVGTTGSVYFQQTIRGYSYCVRISNTSGSMNMWKWDGSSDDALDPNWTEIR